MIKMKAKAGFTNKRVKGPRGDGSVLAGESFETDWLHAKELAAGGLAAAENARDLEREPTEPVEPHHGLSVGAHAAVNDRRAKAADKAKADKAAADKGDA